MSVKAKFSCSSIEKYKAYPEGFAYKIKFHAVAGGSEENKMFYSSTPSGNFEIAGVNESVQSQFEPGKEYYLTIEQAD